MKVMLRCLSAPDAISLHHCLKNKQLKNSFSGKDPVKRSIMHFKTLGKYLLFTKYLTINMLTAQQKKGHKKKKKKVLVPHCPDKRSSTVCIN